MSLWYKFLYAVGVTPWEASGEGPLAEQVAGLLEREEKNRAPPYGKAIDLGCGTGTWSIVLARRGWEVTGVDVVAKAIRAARGRARDAGEDVTFAEGDVTALREAGVGSGFDLVVDLECFNHLDAAQRARVGREVNEVTAPDAIMLMLVWEPGRRGPLPPGASRHEIEAAFPGWTVTDEEAYAARDDLPFWLRRIGLRFYRLARTATRRAGGDARAQADDATLRRRSSSSEMDDA